LLEVSGKPAGNVETSIHYDYLLVELN